MVHAIAGQVDANKLLQEARWASDTRKAAQTKSTRLGTGKTDMREFALQVRKAHGERYHADANNRGEDKNTIPAKMPRVATQETKTHWLLAKQPLAELDTIYPIVWRQILNEELSALPVERR